METTVLVVAGKKLKVPRLLIRALQVAVSVFTVRTYRTD